MPKETTDQHLARHDRQISIIRNEKLQPATEKHEGLMTAKDKLDLTHAGGLREWIGDTIVDVLALPQGNYVSTFQFLTNTPYPAQEGQPSAALCEIDVKLETAGGNTRKQIYFLISGTGELFYRNTHTNNGGNTPKLWQVVRKETPLWSGNVSAVGSVINLADSLTNYTKIIIAFTAQSNAQERTLYLASQLTLRDTNLPNSDNGTWVAQYETVLASDGDRKLTITVATGLLQFAGSIVPDANLINVVGVKGVR